MILRFGSLELLLGLVLGSLTTILNGLGTFWARLGRSRRSWGRLGFTWAIKGSLGRFLVYLEWSLGCFMRLFVLGLSWVHRGVSRSHLAPLFKILGLSLCNFGLILGHIGPSWVLFGLS